MDQTNWDEIDFLDSPEGWIELEDSTWDALISATAGSANIRKASRTTSGLSPEDQAVVDEMTDLHLADAQIPLRPDGYVWYIRSAPDFTTLDALHDGINRHIDNVNRHASRPEELRDLLTEFFHKRYSGVS